MLRSAGRTSQLRLLVRGLGLSGAELLSVASFSTSQASQLSDDDRIYTNLYGRWGTCEES